MPAPSAASGRLLVADADPGAARALAATARELGYEAETVDSSQAALARLRAAPFDLLLADQALPEGGGPLLLREARRVDPQLVGILLAEKERLPAALAAVPGEAFDWLQKPVPPAILAAALARAQAVRRLRQEVAALQPSSALVALSRRLSGLLDEEGITEAVLEAAAAQTDADEVTLLRVETEDSTLQVIGARGAGRAAIVGERVPSGTGPVGFVAQALEPLILHGQVQDPRIAPLRPRAEIRSTLVVPLIAEGKPVGVLTANAIRHRPFTPADLSGLETLAAIAAPALKTAQLVAALRREVARLTGAPRLPAGGLDTTR